MAATAVSPAQAAPEPAAATSPGSEPEEYRWLKVLIVPFILGASFFALSMHNQWWMVPAFLFGPLLLIANVIYLCLNVGSQPNP